MFLIAIPGYFIGAAFGITLNSPFEVVKIRLQSQPVMLKSGNLMHKYYGPKDCFKRVYRDESAKAFWKGNNPNILMTMSTQIFMFYMKEDYKDKFPYKKSDKWQYYLYGKIMRNGLAALWSVVLFYPLDYARTRLINDIDINGKARFSSVFDVFLKTIKSEGILGIYKGVLASFLGIFLYRTVYVVLNWFFKAKAQKKNFLIHLLILWGMNSISILSIYPIDTVMRRMMMASCQGKYVGYTDCITTIIKNEGVNALFAGAGLSMLASLGPALIWVILQRYKNYPIFSP